MKIYGDKEKNILGEMVVRELDTLLDKEGPRLTLKLSLSLPYNSLFRFHVTDFTNFASKIGGPQSPQQ
jgi:hypothetical protein